MKIGLEASRSGQMNSRSFFAGLNRASDRGPIIERKCTILKGQTIS